MFTALESNPSFDGQLALLASVTDRAKLEVIVVSPAARGTREGLRLSHPALRIVIGAEDLSARMLRERGVAEATGDVIMVIDGTHPLDERSLTWILRSVGLADSADRIEREHHAAPSLEIERTG